MPSPEINYNSTLSVWDTLLDACKTPTEKINVEMLIAGINFRVTTDLARSFLDNGRVSDEKINAFLDSYRISNGLRYRASFLIRGFLESRMMKRISADRIKLQNDDGIWSDLKITLISKLEIPSSEVVPASRQINELRSALRIQISNLIVDGQISDERIARMVDCYDFPVKIKRSVARAIREAVRKSAEAIEQ